MGSGLLHLRMDRHGRCAPSRWRVGGL